MMVRRAAGPRRSRTEWAGRIAIAVALTVFGTAAVTFSAAQVVQRRSATLAHQLAPYDGRIAALLAVTLASEAKTPADRRRSDHLARAALRRDPIAVQALSALGLNLLARGDTANARRVFAYAQTLSRRDLMTQLWAIEDAVGQGNVVGALRHYDTVLRTRPDMSEILFPVLASASVGPEVRAGLVRTLADKPLWGPDFLNFVARKAANPPSTAQLFLALRRAGVTVPAAADAGVTDALVAGGHVNDAWAYYARTHPGADRRRSRDPHFAATLETPSQLDWTAFSDGGIITSIQNGVVDFSAPASIGGSLVQQVQLLPPGHYRLIGHSIGIDQAQSAQPYWVLSCKGGAELGRVVVPNSADHGGVFSGMFSVPSECPIQTLTLIARPSDAITGLSGQIDRAALVPAEQP